MKRIIRIFSLTLALVGLSCSLAMADYLSLKVVVKSVPDNDEPVPIKDATVRIETSDEALERSTNAKGEATFKVEGGEVFIIVTGEDTEQHWATGTCSVEIKTDLVVKFQLDLEKLTPECEPEEAPRESTGDAETKDD